MATEKVTIVEATFDREVALKDGKFYSYKIKIKGQPHSYSYLSKSNPQTKFVVGQEVEAELNQNDKGYWNIKLPKTAGGFGGGGGAKWEDMKKGFAYLGAMTLLANDKIKDDQIEATIKRSLEKYLG